MLAASVLPTRDMWNMKLGRRTGVPAATTSALISDKRLVSERLSHLLACCTMRNFP